MEDPSDIPSTDPDVAKKPLNGVTEAEMPEKAGLPDSIVAVDLPRSVNFILDPSAFTLGLGNIERWFDQGYFQSQVEDKNENIHLNLYLPTYTLHELDYQRRGPIVGSTKASEALKFIDRILESDDGLSDIFDDDDDDDDDEEEKGSAIIDKTGPSPKSGHFSHTLHLEHRTHQFPQWQACAKFQIKSPSAQELPNHGKYSLYDEINHFGGDAKESINEEPEVPARLKHLIRSGVYLTRMKHNGPENITGDMWKMVTEDATIKVWASCFGIDCLNINEAELLLFHGKDLAKFEIKPQGADFFSSKDVYQVDLSESLHKKVNTTSYNYTNLKALESKKQTKRTAGKRKPAKGPKNTSQSQNVISSECEPSGVKVEGGVITEDYNMINFAPREQSTKLVVSKLFAKESKSSSKPKKATKVKTVQKSGEGDTEKASSKEKKPSTKQKPMGKKKTHKESKPRTESKTAAEKVQTEEAEHGSPSTEAPKVAIEKSTQKSASGKKVRKKKPSSKKKASKTKDADSPTESTKPESTSDTTAKP